jgi:hypothetical protein
MEKKFCLYFFDLVEAITSFHPIFIGLSESPKASLAYFYYALKQSSRKLSMRE